jgi:hypothetical protein
MHTHLTMPVNPDLGGTGLGNAGLGNAGLSRTGLSRTGLSGGGASAAQPSPKLVHAAHEFEGMLMEELLKPLAGGGVPGDDGDDGFGIANQLIAQIARREAAESSRSENNTGLAREIGKGTGRSKIKPLK